jgi:hypothetical protein
MGSLQHKDVLCPYYNGESQQKIYCEGLCIDATTSHTFRTKEAYLAYRKDICCCHYSRCWHFRAMDRKNNQ